MVILIEIKFMNYTCLQMCLKAQVRFVSDKDAGVTLKISCRNSCDLYTEFNESFYKERSLIVSFK